MLGDWYANVLNHGPERHVVLVSEATFLPLIVPARKAEFPRLVGHYLIDLLHTLGVPPEKVQAEVEAMDAYAIAKTASRQVLGVQNDYIMMATHHMPEASRLLTSLRLSGTPLGPLDYDSAEQRTCEAFGIPNRRDRWWRRDVRGPHIT